MLKGRTKVIDCRLAPSGGRCLHDKSSCTFSFVVSSFPSSVRGKATDWEETVIVLSVGR